MLKSECVRRSRNMWAASVDVSARTRACGPVTERIYGDHYGCFRASWCALPLLCACKKFPEVSVCPCRSSCVHLCMPRGGACVNHEVHPSRAENERLFMRRPLPYFHPRVLVRSRSALLFRRFGGALRAMRDASQAFVC